MSMITPEVMDAHEKNTTGLKIILPKGLIGYQNLHHFIIKPLVSNLSENIFWHLIAQDFGELSIERPNYLDLSFILMAIDLEDPNGISHGINLDKEDVIECLDILGIDLKDSLCFLIVSIEMAKEQGAQNITVNLRAPFIYHVPTKQGWQIILANREYSLAYPLSNG